MQLPIEIIVQVARNLDFSALLSLKLTCKRMNYLLSEHERFICKSMDSKLTSSIFIPKIDALIDLKIREDHATRYTLPWLKEVELMVKWYGRHNRYLEE